MTANSTTAQTISIHRDGMDRKVTVVRADHHARSTAIVALLHGLNQAAEGFRRFSGHAFDTWAGEFGAVLAYLNGYRGNWNDAQEVIEISSTQARYR